MKYEIKKVKVGLGFVLAGLLFGLFMGVLFGVYEDGFKDYITDGILMNPAAHENQAVSEEKIWRYAQRSHFHAMGIAAASLALILLVMASSLKTRMKSLTATLISMINLYPLAWLSMFLLSPSMGRTAAHSHWITEAFTYISLLGILFGLAILISHIYFNTFHEDDEFEDNYREQIAEY